MRRQVFQVPAMVVILFAGLANAQVFPPTPGDLKVNIPFDFVVNEQVHSAGDYIVHKLDAKESLELCEEGITCVTVITSAVVGETPSQPTLRFTQYGDQHFLSEIWLIGEAGCHLPVSQMEATVAKSQVKPEVASVGASALCVHFTPGGLPSWH